MNMDVEEEVITNSFNSRVCKRDVEVNNFRAMVELTIKISILCSRYKAMALVGVIIFWKFFVK